MRLLLTCLLLLFAAQAEAGGPMTDKPSPLFGCDAIVDAVEKAKCIISENTEWPGHPPPPAAMQPDFGD